MIHSGNADSIMEFYVTLHPELPEALHKARQAVMATKREIYPYQAAALYHLTAQYNQPDARIVELGTAYGYSAAIMALAAPEASIVTCNPAEHELLAARKALAVFPNVEVTGYKSWDYLPFAPVELSMIFVDADHKRIAHDLPWWNHLRADGLFLHHDYSPAGSGRECPPVYDTLNAFGRWLGRDMDELIVDDQQVGLGGWYRRFTDPDYHGELASFKSW